MFKKKKPILEFWTEIPGLTGLEELRPQRMNKFLPDWWTNSIYRKGSIRTCPSFPEVFNSSFVVPMWCDTIFFKENGKLFWEVPDKKFSWDIKLESQFIEFTSKNIQEKYHVAMANCPWRLRTPRGYSVYEMPVFWHLNENISLAPGIINTDVFHYINPDFFIYIEEGQCLEIKRGDPLVAYFPFKRESFGIESREKTKIDEFHSKKSDLIWKTKFSQGYKDHIKYNERHIPK